jgi:hypothetical protein
VGRRVRLLVVPLVVAAALVCLAAAADGARTPQQQRMAAVVLRWSAALNANDNEGISRLFKVPALIVQGAYTYKLVNQHQVALWFSGLPCSGHVTRILFEGRYATAVFKLANRGKTKCDAPGSLAAARFEIVNGRIVSWVQVAVPPVKGAGPVA